MSGAYVAKPVVVVDPPGEHIICAAVLAAGWSPNWPWPGPLPPGYEPNYSLAMTATDEIAPSGTAEVTGSLRDQGTCATGEPSAITWSATIDGEAVNLRFTGGSYASSISSDCTFVTYWGASPSIEFELTDENDGDTLVLTGTTAISGVAVTQTTEIAVSAAITATITFVSDVETNPQWGVGTEIKGQESGEDAIGQIGFWWDGEETWSEETEGEISVASTSDTTTIQIDVFREEVYDVRIGYASLYIDTINMVWTLTIGETEYTKEVDVESGTFENLDLDEVWLTIDGETGEVTVINP